MKIPFNKPYVSAEALRHIQNALESSHLSGDGPYTKRCHAWLEAHTGCQKALLTHSCTAALEMAAILLDLEPGDEVIMPSYTFVSTANAFVLRGAVPVFVDIRSDTLNIDETLIEAAITPRTRAICVVHYAGVGCEMDAILDVASRYALPIIEDAAQGINASYKGRPLGSFGAMAALSFHETKNIISGEGGALLINDDRYSHRAEIIREKGTNRSQFFRGETDKYTWVDIGSSFLPSELIAALLYSQLSESVTIATGRLTLWDQYDAWAASHERAGHLRRPVIPPHCGHNGHMYYVLLPTPSDREAFLAALRQHGIGGVFHYVPLHTSPAGSRLGRANGPLAVTLDVSERLVRLPFWRGVEPSLERIFEVADSALSGFMQS